MTITRILANVLILSFLYYINVSGQIESKVPEMVIPRYDKVKDMHLEIPLAKDGKAVCSIVTPSIYIKDAESLQNAVFKRTGIKLPIISDTDPQATTPLKANLIILGNRSTSKISSNLYDQFYSLMDLKYPGNGGYSVRTLHDPYANGFGAILIGGSDQQGVSAGTVAFAAVIDTLSASSGSLSVGWTMLTKIGEGVEIPTDIREFETWEASKGYRSVGYFGWNTISKRMAMYYMTGDPFHAREAIRLSFPDAQALKEMDQIDGERIENKKDPLAGPYHYNAMMLILFWELIEESPVFTDAEKLNVTNAFARRLTHEGTTPFDKVTYRLNGVPNYVGNRHAQWSGMSIYTLGRYFNKYYPSPMWAQTERAGKLAFSSLHKHAWVVGESDQLSWYCTGIAPILTYIVMTGDRTPIENGILDTLLNGLEIIISGNRSDRNLNSAALDFLNKAAYLTGDGRWITYRQRTGQNTDIFRLGQSFWPEENIKLSLPVDLAGKWSILYMPKPMKESRNTNFTPEQSFMMMSYRSAADSSGDFILVKGYNAGYRSPYHTYDIIELRLKGTTLLRGFQNQVLSSADGLVGSRVPMDGALIHSDVVGEVVDVVGEVPDMSFINWRRSLALRKEKYVLFADDITFRNNNQESEFDMNVRLETSWEMPGAAWMPEEKYITITPDDNNSNNIFELHSSEPMDVQSGRGISMVWSKPVKHGQKQTFFHLLGQKTTGNQGLSNLKLEDNAAVLTLPEMALAVSGQYNSMNGELILLGERNLYGHGLQSASLGQTLFTSDVPVEVDWDYEKGKISLVNSKSAKITLALSSPKIILNGTSIKGKKEKKLYTFNLPAGRHEITGAKPSANITTAISAELGKLHKQAQQRKSNEQEQKAQEPKSSAPELTPVMQANIEGRPIESITIPSVQGNLICTAAGKAIVILDSQGKEVRKITVAGDVKVLHWWAEPKILLVGCADEQVIAFDENGQKKWEFTSVMDPAVYEAAKPYWFKSRYPGIYGLYSGTFDGGKSRAFVGSACTLEILDETGQLVKRLPTFWGPGRQFLLVEAEDNSKNLLIAKWPSGWIHMTIVNSKNIELREEGYAGVPKGHTFVNGWSAMGRFDNYYVDMDGDGKREVVSSVNGTWNRVTVYNEFGRAISNAQFGPGSKGVRTNIHMMDVGDIDKDGKKEIVVGLSLGYVNMLDYQTKRIWSKLLPSAPVVVKFVEGSKFNWICVGCEDGTVLAMDSRGEIIKQTKVSGKPVDLGILKTKNGSMAVISTENGEISGFEL